jgi:YidC/Oxa1 family membrane protein insertase
MDRKTVIAVVLAVMVIIASMLINNAIAAKRKPAALPPEKPATQQPGPQPGPQQAPQPAPQPAAPAVEQAAGPAAPAEGAQGGAQGQAGAGAVLGTGAVVALPAPDLTPQSFSLETDVYRVVFSNRGGVVTSLQLKDYKNLDGSPVQMVFSRETGRYPFSLHFGDADAPAVNDLFYFERTSTGNSVSFYRTFASPSGVPFVLRKTYQFQPRDYVIELRVSIENSVNEYPDLKFGELAYTLGYGPQIGPPFERLDRYNETRQYMYFMDGKPRTVNVKDGRLALKVRATWAAIVGKYFEVIAVPDATLYDISFVNRPLEGMKDRSSLYFGRPEIKSSKNTDVYRFYVGPRKREVLARYNDAEKNGFKLADEKFDQTVPNAPLIGWLAAILRALLDLFYRLMPNYGVAILLLTLVIKLLFWPLTNKSFQSTAKMQSLQPKMKELQAKYKQNPQKLNQEMAALYKREGVSPLGGCLPLLLQLPIFFALYNLLSTHFELRGASFIPGWINDLSAPEAIATFAPINLLVWKIDALRVLPFLMLGTTFLQTKVSQTTTPTDKNMALMTYFMPAIFFFVLYNMPSGLVLYWTAQNVLGIVQQLFYNRQRRKKQEQLAGGAEVAVVKKRK